MCDSHPSYPSNGRQCRADFSLFLLVPPALAFHLLKILRLEAFTKRKLYCAIYESKQNSRANEKIPPQGNE